MIDWDEISKDWKKVMSRLNEAKSKDWTTEKDEEEDFWEDFTTNHDIQDKLEEDLFKED